MDYNKSSSDILEVLNKNQEELKHARDVLKWLLIIKPDVNDILKISALGHDIERAIKSWEVKDYKLDKEFREKHALRSAEAIKSILAKNDVDIEEIKEIERLILAHEWGGDERQNLIRDADSLANFEWCDDFFGIEKIENLKSVAERMFNRLSLDNRRFIGQIRFKNKEIENIIKQL